MKKILITGGRGFIGRNLVEGLEEKYSIYAPTRKELDLYNLNDILDYIKQNEIDIIIHTAYEKIGHSALVVNEESMFFYNIKIFSNIVKCSENVKYIYYFGSGAEYDKEHYLPMMKETYFGTYIPKDAYGFSKYIMAKMCCGYSNIIEFCILGVYGKYEQWNRRFISNAICRCILEKPIQIEKNVLFDYLYTEDLVKIFEIFLETSPQKLRYNISRGESIDLLSLAQLVRTINRSKVDIIVTESGMKKEYSASNELMLSEIGNFNFTDYKVAIEDLSQYYIRIKDNIAQNNNF